jgi:ubiquitin-conjugating enzyme E2 S
MSNLENHNPQVIRQISREVKSLSTEQLEGIKVNINEADLTNIEAIIDGPAGTPYSSGQFRVKLTLPKDFPSNPPKAYFLTKIFHPNVASNGEICVNTLKKDWKPTLGIKHILLTIKCLLIVPNPGELLSTLM